MAIKLNKFSANHAHNSIELMIVITKFMLLQLKANYVLNATWLIMSNAIDYNVHLNFRDVSIF